jgi:exodeoxyribonuclease VII large subunit
MPIKLPPSSGASLFSVAGPADDLSAPDLRQGVLDFNRQKGPKVYPVSDIVRRVGRLLGDQFPDVWIEGEIDGFKLHSATGHLYFALKDSAARLDAMMPRLRAQRMRFALQNGMKVRARGRLSLYETQGRFQFYVDEVELSGEGELLRAFEELKQRLQKEGLFARERKRRLPPFPRCIGLATSASGAALQDILRVAHRRGRVRFLIAPCQVQGDGAPPQIRAAIERLEPHVDVIIVGRGGGSSADLWAFNDEALARTIARCRVPVVSAVGHEVDFTIADFVADVRAPTPSAAAELVVPLFSALEEELFDLKTRLYRAGQRSVDAARQRLDGELARGEKALMRRVALRRKHLVAAEAGLAAQHPKAKLLRNRGALDQLRMRLLTGQKNLLERRRRGYEGLVAKLDALSPLRVLVRGYAVARDATGRVVTDASTMKPGEPLSVRVSRGELCCRVEEVVAAADPKGEKSC